MRTGLLAGGWLLALTVALGMAGPSGAQTVYRCGPDGRSYSHQPCGDGRVVKADDGRTPSERKEAEAARARESAAAAMLERQRLHDERVAARTGPAGFRTAPENRAGSASVATNKSSKATTKTLRQATQEARKKAPRPPPAAKKAA
jgi:hypothetical protein